MLQENARRAKADFEQRSEKVFSEYYGMDAKPICGDYLTSIAMSKHQSSHWQPTNLNLTSAPF